MIIYSMFDGSGYMVKDWAEAGHKCFCFNSTQGDHGAYESIRVNHQNILYVECWIDEFFVEFLSKTGIPDPDIIFAFPPCNDLTNAGSRHWAKKADKDSEFQNKAARVSRITADFGEWMKVPYMIENPVGRLSTLWRKPDEIIQPFQYGGYLPENDKHPAFPDIIPSRDAYQKTTCLWHGNGLIIPNKKEVPNSGNSNPGWKSLGGKSSRTKLIRSLTPRGFARAIFEANKK